MVTVATYVGFSICTIQTVGIRTLLCYFQTTVLVNSTKEVLHWGLDLRQANKTLKDGIIKFVHPSGVPFISDGNSNGIEGELEPGKVMPIAVVFSPSKQEKKVGGRENPNVWGQL